MTSRPLTVFLASLTVGMLSTTARAWHAPGHRNATLAAANALPQTVPAFFRQGRETVAHCAADPDLFRHPIAPDALDRAESPEHYFDVERLGDTEIPLYRYDFLEWCFANELELADVGLAPYAITEWTQRLTVAFAEHRRWPDDEPIRAKCLVYAGLLAHYAQDLCQPLHTTVHYDGRLKEDGSSPRTGIHLRVDALLDRLPPDREPTLDTTAITPFDDLLPGVLAELARSHQLVDRVYELGDLIPAGDAPLEADSPAEALTMERFHSAARFTARLYLTAWNDSATIQLPDWHDRTAAPPPPQPDSPADTEPGPSQVEPQPEQSPSSEATKEGSPATLPSVASGTTDHPK